MKTLILGGARSGKSQLAEQRAKASGKTLFYLATGYAGDEEMRVRILHHKARRDDEWALIEERVQLAKALSGIDDERHVVVVDCLTLWLSNCLHHGVLESEREKLYTALPDFKSEIIFVSNEVGSGVVPLEPLARDFVDHSGRLHQALAQYCDHVMLVVAGLPMPLKGG